MSMKIEFLGYATFKIECSKLTIMTNPQMTLNAGLKLSAKKSDVILLSDQKFLELSGPNSEFEKVKKNLASRISPKNRKSVTYLMNYGEYEMNDVTIKRKFPSGFFVIDSESVRVVYCGCEYKELKTSYYKDLGDVDVLMVPIGGGDVGPSYKKLEKMILFVEPRYLLLYAYQDKDSKKLEELKPVDEFMSELDLVKNDDEKTLKIKASDVDGDEENMECVVLHKL